MAIRNQQLEELHRLEFKSLESRFLVEIRDGLNCSPFESEAVLEVVREVFFPSLQDSTRGGAALPGQMTLVVVGADEPGGKPLKDCAKVTVLPTVHRGPEDDCTGRSASNGES